MTKNQQLQGTDYRSDYATYADHCSALIDNMSALYLLGFLLTTSISCD